MEHAQRQISRKGRRNLAKAGREISRSAKNKSNGEKKFNASKEV
jgi:hypothetical protein